MEYGGCKSLRWVKKMPSPASCSLGPAQGFPQITTLKEGVGAMLCPLWSSTAEELQIHNRQPSGVLATCAPDRFMCVKKCIVAVVQNSVCYPNLHASSPACSQRAHLHNKGLVYLKGTRGTSACVCPALFASALQFRDEHSAALHYT